MRILLSETECKKLNILMELPPETQWYRDYEVFRELPEDESAQLRLLVNEVYSGEVYTDDGWC